MVLPRELALSFKTEVRSYEETERMRYVTSIERLAKEEGIVETARESVVEVLETRFGEVPTSIVEAINGINEPSLLKTLHKRAIAIPSTTEFQQVLDNLTSGE
jgi:DNA-binding transcriptional MocR family regulator